MDIWIPINFAVAVIAVWMNLRRIQRANARRGLRVAGFSLSLYVATIYLLAIIGWIPENTIGFWLRWFQGVLMAYFIAEALHG